MFLFFFSSRRRHTRLVSDWSSDVCSSDLVLLAEANVPYSSLYEMEQINPEFPNTDVAVVIGANDVVNPDARDNPKSPIAGMPILEVDRARNVVVLKRGKGKGFSGLENPQYFKPETGML